MTCSTCDSANTTVLSHHMMRCSDCTFFFVEPEERARQQASFTTTTQETPSPERIAKLKQKYPKDNPPRKHLYQQYAQTAFDWYGSDMQALDIGASGGFFLYELEQLGVPASNLVVNEIDLSYIALTKDYFGYKTEVTNIEQYTPDRQFDLITMFDVLEHIDDFDKTLQIIHNSLKPGGRLILKLPNGRFAYLKYKLAKLLGRTDKVATYLYIAPGGHLNYWNCDNIKHLESTGFTFESAQTLRPTRQQFARQYVPRMIAYRIDQLLGLSLFPEFVAILQKPNR